MYDTIIIGAGPAGMSAALYAIRSGLSVLLLESSVYGGQIATTPEIENYPGLDSVAGWELAGKMSEQITGKGVMIKSANVKGIKSCGTTKTVITETGNLEAKTIIIANGAKRSKIGCKGEEEFLGRGVSYCAVCDGSFFRNKTVAIVGGGNSALEDALYLAQICKKVYLIHRRDSFRAQPQYVDAIMKKSNVEFLPFAAVTEISGTDYVSSATVRINNAENRTLTLDGVFISIGLTPDNQIFSDTISIDNKGYIIAGEDCETSAKGIYAAGDTRAKPLRQVVTAVCDGAVAATRAADLIRSEQ